MAKRTRILRTTWTCPYCETKIDGLIDKCPTCGRQKPQDITYEMNSKKEEISNEELKQAGINKEECDGKHKDWICDFCGSLNNYSAEVCAECAAPKTYATKEYGGDKINTGRKIEMGVAQKEANQRKIENDSYLRTYAEQEKRDKALAIEQEMKKIEEQKAKEDKNRKKRIFFGSGIALLLMFLCCFCFAPKKESTKVSGFSWDRNITVEEYKTVKEEGYDVPTGGRIYDSEEVKIREDKVVDYYETVEVEKTRKVQTGTKEECDYIDGGNGTTIEECEDVPVYGEETYIIEEEQPVYKYVPVYDTLYYYEIERWVNEKSYPSSGEDQKPYWNENYTLKDNQRDTKRNESYTVHYDNGDEVQKPYEEWKEIAIGDETILTKNRLGIVYGEAEN